MPRRSPTRSERHRPQRSEEAAEALVTVAPLVSRWIERLLAAHAPRLTIPQFLALQAVASEDVSGTELARRAGVSGPAVSQLLAGLVDAGLVQRSEFAQDRRRQALALSTAGTQALRSAQQLLRERVSFLIDGLPGPEADALARALPQVAATLSGAPPPRRPHPPRPPGSPRSPGLPGSPGSPRPPGSAGSSGSPGSPPRSTGRDRHGPPER